MSNGALSSAPAERLALVMRSGAELRIGTDIGDYLRTLLLADARPFGVRLAGAWPADWRVAPGGLAADPL